MELQLCAQSATIELKFSRLYRLANCFTIVGTVATLTGRLFDYGQLRLHRSGATERIDAGKPLPHYAYAWQLVTNFLQAAQGREPPRFTAADVAPSIALIEDAYACAQSFDSPWYRQDPNIFSLTKRLARR
jgi:hypothetical protein